jgi:hypothetical protein
MPFTVEDGTGVADANAFVSLEVADAYHAVRGNTAWTGAVSSPPDAKEAAIVRASAALSGSYSWKGTRLKGRGQGLAWPRTGATDGEGCDVPADTVPAEIVAACCEMAMRELVKPGSLLPDFQPNKQVKATQVGPLSKEYFAPAGGADSVKPVLLIVRELIGGLVASGSNALAGTTIRG